MKQQRAARAEGHNDVDRPHRRQAGFAGRLAGVGPDAAAVRAESLESRALFSAYGLGSVGGHLEAPHVPWGAVPAVVADAQNVADVQYDAGLDRRGAQLDSVFVAGGDASGAFGNFGIEKSSFSPASRFDPAGGRGESGPAFGIGPFARARDVDDDHPFATWAGTATAGHNAFAGDRAIWVTGTAAGDAFGAFVPPMNLVAAAPITSIVLVPPPTSVGTLFVLNVVPGGPVGSYDAPGHDVSPAAIPLIGHGDGWTPAHARFLDRDARELAYGDSGNASPPGALGPPSDVGGHGTLAKPANQSADATPAVSPQSASAGDAGGDHKGAAAPTPGPTHVVTAAVTRGQQVAAAPARAGESANDKATSDSPRAAAARGDTAADGTVGTPASVTPTRPATQILGSPTNGADDRMAAVAAAARLVAVAAQSQLAAAGARAVEYLRLPLALPLGLSGGAGVEDASVGGSGFDSLDSLAARANSAVLLGLAPWTVGTHRAEGRTWVWDATAAGSLVLAVGGYWYCNAVAARRRELEQATSPTADGLEPSRSRRPLSPFGTIPLRPVDAARSMVGRLDRWCRDRIEC